MLFLSLFLNKNWIFKLMAGKEVCLQRSYHQKGPCHKGRGLGGAFPLCLQSLFLLFWQIMGVFSFLISTCQTCLWDVQTHELTIPFRMLVIFINRAFMWILGAVLFFEVEHDFICRTEIFVYGETMFSIRCGAHCQQHLQWWEVKVSEPETQG